MNHHVQLAWCVLCFAILGYALCRIVGVDEGLKLFARVGIAAVLALVFIEPVGLTFTRMLAEATAPTPHGARGATEFVATSPYVIGLGLLVVVGHVAFLLFVLRLRGGLRRQSRERTGAPLRGRERVEPRSQNEGGRS